MKKYITGIAIGLIILNSCKNEKTQNNTQENLQTKKEQIEKQIDSLHSILVQINQKLESNEQKEVPSIEAQSIVPKKFIHYIELQGSINTDGNVLVKPEAMGQIKKVYKEEGDKVRKGETIMLLDDSSLRSQISEIETQYELARTSYERQKRLWEQKIGSEMSYLQAKTQKESLAKKLQTLKIQLDKMRVKAPISGTLDDLMVKEGEIAAPQMPVARIVNLTKVYAQADVSEKYLPKIKKGSPVSIDFPELNKQIKSTISYVGNFIHPTNRTFKIRVNIFNPDEELKPNLTGNLKIKDFEKDDAIVIPLSLLQEDREGNNFVYILVPTDKQKGIYRVKKQKVETGGFYKNHILISSGLQEGDIIALEGARGLSEGELVKIINELSVKKTQKDSSNKDETKSETTKYHTVKEGETLYSIHKKYGISINHLKEWNHLKSNQLKKGQKLIVSQK
jgi:RND family efflux transporter MFP subunit